MTPPFALILEYNIKGQKSIKWDKKYISLDETRKREVKEN